MRKLELTENSSGLQDCCRAASVVIHAKRFRFAAGSRRVAGLRNGIVVAADDESAIFPNWIATGQYGDDIPELHIMIDSAAFWDLVCVEADFQPRRKTLELVINPLPCRSDTRPRRCLVRHGVAGFESFKLAEHAFQ